MSQQLILSMGACGRFAGLVVPELVRRGALVRALVRSAERIDGALERGAAQVAIADLRDPVSLDAALKGVDGVFYLSPGFAADESQLGLNMVAAAMRAGVRRFVFSSVMHTTLELDNHRAKAPVESVLYSSGMEFVVLHPATFFQNLEDVWQAVIARGVIAEPYPKKARIARVDYRDVAEIAAMALTTDRLTYGTFELCADGLPNREEIAEMIAEVLGRGIEAAEPSFDEWAEAAGLADDERQYLMLQKMYQYYGAYGAHANSLTLRAILDREPRTLRGYIRELADRRAAAV